MPHATVHRIRTRRTDEDLHTTRLIGAGWSWDCSCGAKGEWHSTREDAKAWAKFHKVNDHPAA